MAKEFTPRQQAVIALVSDPDPKNDCWGNYLRAVAKAGYSPGGLRSAASRLAANPDVRREVNKRVAEHVKESLFSPDIVRASLLRLARKSEEAKDRSNAIRAWEKLGECFALFSSRNITTLETTDRQSELDEAEQAMARRLSGLMFDTTRLPGGGRASNPPEVARRSGGNGDGGEADTP